MNNNELEEAREFLNLFRQLKEEDKRHVLYMLIGAVFAINAKQ